MKRTTLILITCSLLLFAITGCDGNVPMKEPSNPTQPTSTAVISIDSSKSVSTLDYYAIVLSPEGHDGNVPKPFYTTKTVHIFDLTPGMYKITITGFSKQGSEMAPLSDKALALGSVLIEIPCQNEITSIELKDIAAPAPEKVLPEKKYKVRTPVERGDKANLLVNNNCGITTYIAWLPSDMDFGELGNCRAIMFTFIDNNLINAQLIKTDTRNAKSYITEDGYYRDDIATLFHIDGAYDISLNSGTAEISHELSPAYTGWVAYCSEYFTDQVYVDFGKTENVPSGITINGELVKYEIVEGSGSVVDIPDISPLCAYGSWRRTDSIPFDEETKTALKEYLEIFGLI